MIVCCYNRENLHVSTKQRHEMMNDNKQLTRKVPQMTKLTLSLTIVCLMLARLDGAFGFFNCQNRNQAAMQQSAAYPGLGWTGSPMIKMPGDYATPAFGGGPFAMGGGGGLFGQNSMKKSLFQPKWRTGSLLGGPKPSLANWMGLGSSSNFYRPGFGNYQAMMHSPASLAAGSYSYPPGSISDQQVTSALAAISQQSPYISSMAAAHSSSPYGDINAGWSLPSATPYSAKIQQSQVNLYDSNNGPAKLTAANLVDLGSSYGAIASSSVGGGTKGGSLSNKLSSTTKNLLIANGGYNYHDSHLMGIAGNLVATNNNFTNFGYSYPDWYAISTALQKDHTLTNESPARIAQQLVARLTNLRNQRLQLEQESISPSDAPRFVGFGRVETFDGLEVKLTCSFGELIDQNNRPIWVKFVGPVSVSVSPNGTMLPSFNCVDSKCRAHQIETTNDYRYSFETGPTTSTLIIRLPRISDYGIYRCSALTKSKAFAAVSPTTSNSWQTTYQIVKFSQSPQ